MTETATTTEHKQAAAPRQGGAPRAPMQVRRGGPNDRGPRRQRRRREPRQRSEFDNVILGIRRVTRVVAGGRRFSFSVTIALGNGRGKVGIGLGKAMDTALAIEKATKQAQRNMIEVPVTKDASIPHDVRAKYAAAQVLLIPTPGKGMKAGSVVRTVLELTGIRNVSGKILSRSKNPLNNAQATIKALAMLKPRKENKGGKKDDDKKKSDAKDSAKKETADTKK